MINTAIEHLEEYLINVDLSETTKNRRRYYMLKLLKYLSKHYEIPIDSIDLIRFHAVKYGDKIITYTPISQDVIKQFLTYFYDKGATHGEYNRCISSLRGFFHYLVDSNIITDNPMAGIKRANEVVKTNYHKVLTEKDCVAILEHSYNVSIHDFTLILFAMTTGARPSEICNLTEECINLTENVAHIKGKKVVNRRYITEGMRETLLEYLPCEERKRALEGKKKRRYVFFSDFESGKRLNSADVNKIIIKYCKLAGISKKITAYWLRHTYANLLYENGFTFNEIKHLMDHVKNTSTKFYVNLQQKENVLDAINNSESVNAIEEFEKAQFKLVKYD